MRAGTFPLAERFHAPQGEGLYSGVQMAFLRLVGCSVGQGVCTACDTDFDRAYPALGGGHYTAADLVAFAGDCRNVCLTGGEPLDRDVRPILAACEQAGIAVHVETSGTTHPAWLDPDRSQGPRSSGQHAIRQGDAGSAWRWAPLWVTVSPKPGYRAEMVQRVADEVKVILGGLGDGPGWPTLDDALRWADMGKLTYVQPRNGRDDVDRANLDAALEAVARHPQLRLSVQLHKLVRTR